MINFKRVTLAKAKLVTWQPEKSHVIRDKFGNYRCFHPSKISRRYNLVGIRTTSAITSKFKMQRNINSTIAYLKDPVDTLIAGSQKF